MDACTLLAMEIARYYMNRVLSVDTETAEQFDILVRAEFGSDGFSILANGVDETDPPARLARFMENLVVEFSLLNIRSSVLIDCIPRIVEILLEDNLSRACGRCLNCDVVDDKCFVVVREECCQGSGMLCSKCTANVIFDPEMGPEAFPCPLCKTPATINDQRVVWLCNLFQAAQIDDERNNTVGGCHE